MPAKSLDGTAEMSWPGGSLCPETLVALLCGAVW